LQNPQQQLNAGRSSNASSGGVNNEVQVGLDSSGGLGGPDASSRKAAEDNDCRSQLPAVSTKNCRDALGSRRGPFLRFIESFSLYNDKRHHSTNNETHKHGLGSMQTSSLRLRPLLHLQRPEQPNKRPRASGTSTDSHLHIPPASFLLLAHFNKKGNNARARFDTTTDCSDFAEGNIRD
jgi:hypothetical protein